MNSTDRGMKVYSDVDAMLHILTLGTGTYAVLENGCRAALYRKCPMKVFE